MFFLLSKILVFLSTPLIYCIGLLLTGLFLRDSKTSKRVLYAGVFLLVFMSNSFILDEFMRAWEIPATADNTLEKHEVGMVLGGMLSYDHTLNRMQFNRSGDRLHQAVLLYKKGKIGKILFVGDSGMVSLPKEIESIYAREYLRQIGIPDTDILIEKTSRNTFENARASKILLDSLHIQGRSLLITSAIHMRRARGCFSKAGVVFDCYSTDRYSGSRKFELDHCLLPRASALAEWDALIHEWIGYLSYKIASYL